LIFRVVYREVKSSAWLFGSWLRYARNVSTTPWGSQSADFCHARAAFIILDADEIA
jgi:hypothetical protein